ncbi:radical SAM protein [Candidatus Zixiibacteriota bacterium]
MGRKIRWRTGSGTTDHSVIEALAPHILVNSRKELHGWWRGKRECTAERLLINPYNGCSIDCFCCYAKALPGYFQLYRQRGIITVCRDFDQVVSRQLDSLSVASCGYLSPVTDPFQPVEDRYRLSEKIIAEFTRRNIPIEFITKSNFSSRVVDLLRRQEHSFGQISILTPRESLRRRLMIGGASTDQLFGNLKRLADAGVHAVCRVDPIIPYFSDQPSDLATLVQRAAGCGAKHIVASVMDIPRRISAEIFAHLDRLDRSLSSRARKLYRQAIGGSLQADLGYRRKLFSRLRSDCDRAGITFALCMEYRLDDGVPLGLNAEFSSAANCEGINIPVYLRRGDRFEPAAECDGACLKCRDPRCGIDDLSMGRRENSRRDFYLRDYRRWSRQMEKQ